MENKQSLFQNRWLVVTVIVLVPLCILVLGTKFVVEQSVKNQLCRIGSSLTGRKVEAGSVNYNMLFWDLRIDDLHVMNPPGYSQKNPAIEIKRIKVIIAPWSILRRLVHIRELHIDGVSLYPEIKKIPISFNDWMSLAMDPEINLVDFSPNAVLSREAEKSSLWFLQIDDFKVSDVKVHFVNILKLKQYLPKDWQNSLPHVLPLKYYQQKNLGADGKHTGAMIGGEILDRHIAELKVWYDGKKNEICEKLKFWKKKEKRKE